MDAITWEQVLRDMMFHAKSAADWKRIKQRKLRPNTARHQRENSSRIDYTYRVGDLVLIVKDNNRMSKLNQPTEGPF